MIKTAWETVPLTDYEAHMSFSDVGQMQALNEIMRGQFSRFPVSSAAVWGVAGGNGLEYVDTERLKHVWGIDINQDYLDACQARYPQLADVLTLLRLDLGAPACYPPGVELVIADLVIEYIGLKAFATQITRACPRFVSCVVQRNIGNPQFVSPSPYLHSFDAISALHTDINPEALAQAMREIGMERVGGWRETVLPNGKALLMLDFQRGLDDAALSN